MLSERHRILELALESLEDKKRKLDEEIAQIARELGGRAAMRPAAVAPAGPGAPGHRRRSRFSQEEKIRRSQRMKAYWENWRKKKMR
jgi:hypothetical protein